MNNKEDFNSEMQSISDFIKGNLGRGEKEPDEQDLNFIMNHMYPDQNTDPSVEERLRELKQEPWPQLPLFRRKRKRKRKRKKIYLVMKSSKDLAEN